MFGQSTPADGQPGRSRPIGLLSFRPTISAM